MSGAVVSKVERIIAWNHHGFHDARWVPRLPKWVPRFAKVGSTMPKWVERWAQARRRMPCSGPSLSNDPSRVFFYSHEVFGSAIFISAPVQQCRKAPLCMRLQTSHATKASNDPTVFLRYGKSLQHLNNITHVHKGLKRTSRILDAKE